MLRWFFPKIKARFTRCGFVLFCKLIEKNVISLSCILEDCPNAKNC
jgi:hypothetical protein